MQTGDFKFIKTLNGQLVLNLIRKHEVISSSELVKITKLRPSTIFNILKELSSKSLVVNLGKGESTERGGKKPFLWKLNSEAAYVIGLDIEIDAMTSVILNMDGSIVSRDYIRFERIGEVNDLINIIRDVVDNLCREANVSIEKILGMGIALPAIVNSENGRILRTDIISDKDIPLTDKLAKYYEYPIIVENNANATAMGAKWVGAAKEHKNFLVVLAEFEKKVGGMGVGIVIDEHLYYGSTNCAGELNIPLMNLNQMKIFFRNQIEESELLREYDNYPEKIDTEILIKAAKKGDELAISLFKRLGDQIGKKIAPAVALLNPETLIVAGTISELDVLITEPIMDAIKMETLSFISDALTVRTSIHGVCAVAIGAASLILNDFFRVPLVKRNGITEQVNIF